MPEILAPAVAITDVSKMYGYVPALRNVTLEIARGAVVGFYGHNGAGKTTLLKIIATHIAPSSGTVRILGDDVRILGPDVRRRIGLVTHENYLYPELSIRENLHFYARLFSLDPEPLARDLTEYFGLRQWYDTRIAALSFGLRKRADLVRALLHHPDVLLLDEPFAALDARTCDLMADYILSRKEAGTTILLSSHSREWMEHLCDRELVFDRGKIIHDRFQG